MRFTQIVHANKSRVSAFVPLFANRKHFVTCSTIVWTLPDIGLQLYSIYTNVSNIFTQYTQRFILKFIKN